MLEPTRLNKWPQTPSPERSTSTVRRPLTAQVITKSANFDKMVADIEGCVYRRTGSFQGPFPVAPGWVTDQPETRPQALSASLGDVRKLPEALCRKLFSGRVQLSLGDSHVFLAGQFLTRFQVKVSSCIGDGGRQYLDCTPASAAVVYRVHKLSEANLRVLSSIAPTGRPVMMVKITKDTRYPFRLLELICTSAADMPQDRYTCIAAAELRTGAPLNTRLTAMGHNQQRLCCQADIFHLVAQPLDFGLTEFRYRTQLARSPRESLTLERGGWTLCGGRRNTANGPFEAILVRPTAQSAVAVESALDAHRQQLRSGHEPTTFHLEPMATAVPPCRWLIDPVGRHAYDIREVVEFMQSGSDCSPYVWAPRPLTAQDLQQIVTHSSQVGRTLLVPGGLQHPLQQGHYDALGEICDRLDANAYRGWRGDLRLNGAAVLDHLFDDELAVRNLLVAVQTTTDTAGQITHPFALWEAFKSTPSPAHAKPLAASLRRLGETLAAHQGGADTAEVPVAGQMPLPGTRLPLWRRWYNALSRRLHDFTAIYLPFFMRDLGPTQNGNGR